MTNTKNGKALKGKELITIGIFSAICFVINFAFMLLGGLYPMMWILMRDSFLAQISEQGMPESYISTLEAVSSPAMLAVLSCDRILEIGQERGHSDGHSIPDGGEKCKTGGK